MAALFEHTLCTWAGILKAFDFSFHYSMSQITFQALSEIRHCEAAPRQWPGHRQHHCHPPSRRQHGRHVRLKCQAQSKPPQQQMLVRSTRATSSAQAMYAHRSKPKEPQSMSASLRRYMCHPTRWSSTGWQWHATRCRLPPSSELR